MTPTKTKKRGKSKKCILTLNLDPRLYRAIVSTAVECGVTPEKVVEVLVVIGHRSREEAK